MKLHTWPFFFPICTNIYSCSVSFSARQESPRDSLLISVVRKSKRCAENPVCQGLIYQSNWSFNISPGNPPGIWTFEDWLVQIPSPRGKKAAQMPHRLVLKYLSSKTNFVFNQTLFKLFRVRYAVINFKLLFKTHLRELFTNKGEILSWKSVKPCKDRKNSPAYYARTSVISDSNSPPFQGNIQIAPYPGKNHSQIPGVCQGMPSGGMLKLRFERYIR